MSQIVINGDNIEVLKKYPDNYFDAVVTDPPYGLGKEPVAAEVMASWVSNGYHEISGKGFMGKEWDAFVPQPIFWKEVFRVLKHGGHVLAFYGTRTYDWGVMAMRFAGFEVRDCIQWLYASGFPKSHNISIAIDKLHGAEREVVGKGFAGLTSGSTLTFSGTKEFDLTAPATEDAKRWHGWGSNIKPANEPIVLARKPLEDGLSIAENVLKWGTGGININATRIPTPDNLSQKLRPSKPTTFNSSKMIGTTSDDWMLGRFPANIILQHHPECVCKGLKKINQNKPIREGYVGHPFDAAESQIQNGNWGYKQNLARDYGEETIEVWECHEDCPVRIMDIQSGDIDERLYDKAGTLKFVDGYCGGASRFFYVAKPSKWEKNNGLDDFESQPSTSTYAMPKLTCSVCGSKAVNSSGHLTCGCGGSTHYEKQNSLESDNNLAGGNKNFHPTIKPVKLMQYLAKMITPVGGKVLDPFCGSGTTGIACKLEGFEFVGIEQDPEYTKLAQSRISNYSEDYEMPLPMLDTSDSLKPKQLQLF